MQNLGLGGQYSDGRLVKRIAHRDEHRPEEPEYVWGILSQED